jgi:hypothetical protein
VVAPALNLFFPKSKRELEQTNDRLEQARNEPSA